MHQTRTGDQNLVKALNKAIVLNILRSLSPISRASIAKVSGLNKATVSALVDELIGEHMVLELGPGESSGGRRPQLLMMNERAGVAVGVELGVDYMLVVLLDLKAKVLWRRRVSQDHRAGPAACLDRMGGLIRQGLNSVPPAPRGLLGVGVGVAGLVDHHLGRLLYAPNLHWEDVPVRDWLQERMQVPVVVDNEANAGAVGELWAGIAAGVRDFVFLSASTGLGAGIVLNRELYRGRGGVAGELGHCTIDVSGPVCSCGNRGCWEIFASEQALRQHLARLVTDTSALAKTASSQLTTDVVVGAAQQGDSAAMTALSIVGEYLGVGIANVINTFNPELVVIGGGLAAGGAYILNPARQAVESRALAHPRGDVRIALSGLGHEAGAIGAGALVLQDHFRLPVVAV